MKWNVGRKPPSEGGGEGERSGSVVWCESEETVEKQRQGAQEVSQGGQGGKKGEGGGWVIRWRRMAFIVQTAVGW